jgi:hypothetical protein
VRAHPPDVAPSSRVSWRLACELLFVIVAVVAFGCSVGAVMAIVVMWTQLWVRASRPM